MDEADRADYVERYEARLREFGYSPETLGWGKHGRQEVRFSVLAAAALANPAGSVLDCGCGFADLYDFLRARGWNGTYVGVDISSGLLAEARTRHPELRLIEADATSDKASLPLSDYVIASGVFNAELPSGKNIEHIRRSLETLHALAKRQVAVDFLSSYVDFRKPGSWHTDPSDALRWARAVTRRVALRHDYMPFEFALIMEVEDAVSERNVFTKFEDRLNS